MREENRVENKISITIDATKLTKMARKRRYDGS